MECYLCHSSDIAPLKGEVRDRPYLKPLQCLSCGLVFLNSQDHIVENYYHETYTQEQFANMDWHSYLAQYAKDDIRRANEILPLISNRSYLDIGCGSGGVLRKVKDFCSEVYGVELQKRWRDELIKRGFTIFDSLQKVKEESIDISSLFHVLAHVHDPIAFLQEIRSKMKCGGTIFIETPNADDALLSLYHCKAYSSFIYLSPHLFVFNSKTLALLFQKAGFKNWTIKQIQRYPLSNHLMWLSQGEPKGHQKWFFIDTKPLTEAYENSLASLGCCDTLYATLFCS